MVQVGDFLVSVDEFYRRQLRLRQTIIDWGAYKSIQAAGSELSANKYDYAQGRADLVLATKQQYYALLRAQLLAEVADSALVVSEQELRRVSSLFELGMVAKGDVLKAKVRVSQSKLDVITSRNTVVTERAAPGAPDRPGSERRPGGDARHHADAGRGRFGRGLQRGAGQPLRPEGGRGRARRGERRRGRRKGRLLPDPRRRARLLAHRTTIRRCPAIARASGSLTPQRADLQRRSTAPRARSSRARRRPNQQRYAYDKKRLDVQVEVRKSVSTALQANEGLTVAIDQVESAREDLKLSQEKYNVGSGTILDLIDSQVALQRARSNYVNALTLVRIAEASLERVRGRTY